MGAGGVQVAYGGCPIDSHPSIDKVFRAQDQHQLSERVHNGIEHIVLQGNQYWEEDKV